MRASLGKYVGLGMDDVLERFDDVPEAVRPYVIDALEAALYGTEKFGALPHEIQRYITELGESVLKTVDIPEDVFSEGNPLGKNVIENMRICTSSIRPRMENRFRRDEILKQFDDIVAQIESGEIDPQKALDLVTSAYVELVDMGAKISEGSVAQVELVHRKAITGKGLDS